MDKISGGAIVVETVMILRREWRALIIWIAIHAVASIAALFAVRPLVLARIAAALTGARAAARPAPGMGWALVAVALLLAMLLYGAVFRAVFLPAERRRAFVRLGVGEVLMAKLVAVLGIALYALMLLVTVATIRMAAALVPLLGMGPVSQAAPFLGLAARILPMAAIVYLAIRLSPAAPLTLLRGRIVIGPAWRLTRRHAWPLFGMHSVIMLPIALAYAALVAVSMSDTLAALGTPDPALRQWRVLLIERAAWGDGIVGLAFSTLCGGVLGGLMVALHGGALAVATRRLLEAGGSAYARVSPSAAEEIAP